MPMMNIKGWNSLSMAEKSSYIGVGVRNGLVSLKDIREAYRKFAEGGNLEEPNEPLFPSHATPVYQGGTAFAPIDFRTQLALYNLNKEIKDTSYLMNNRVKALSKQSSEIWDNINRVKGIALDRGYSLEQACAIAANMYAESGGKSIVQRTSNGLGPAVGYFQMEQPVRSKYLKWLRDNKLENNIVSETNFVLNELESNPESVYDRYNKYYLPELKKAKTKEQRESVNKKYATLKRLSGMSEYKGITGNMYRKDFNSGNISKATRAFMGLIERPGIPRLQDRQDIANYLYSVDQDGD